MISKSIGEIYKDFHKELDVGSIDSILEKASKLFDAPVVFTDEYYNLISIYPKKQIGDLVYDTLLDKKELSIDLITSFQEEYLEETGQRYKPFYAEYGLVGKYPRIFSEVYDKDRILGHVGILVEKEKYSPKLLEIAEILNNILKIKIKLSKHYSQNNSLNLQYLIDKNTNNQIKNRAKYNIEKNNVGDSLLIVAPLLNTKAHQAFASVAVNYCVKKFKEAIPTIYGNDLVILINCKKSNKLNNLKEIGKEITDFLNKYQTYSGIVYPIKNIINLHKYYMQAKYTALFISKKTGDNEKSSQKNYKIERTDFYYSKLEPEPMYVYLAKNTEIKYFLSSILDKIRKYDYRNKTEYYLTLETYCFSLFENNKTAQELHIHRNTLLYRLRKIQDIFSVDLKDIKVMSHLLLSFEITRNFS